MTTRHEFLAQLHDLLQPRGYLEIGVQFGDSLRLVRPGTLAIGIDPNPHLHGHFPGTTQVARTTSDNYFEAGPVGLEHVDLAFIDGMHLFEYALRDFMNVERYSNPRTVVVFDDVLPRNQHEAAREQCPGDWTGDVWKVGRVLETWRPDLKIHWVDTQPTGTLLVYNLNPTSHKLRNIYDTITKLGLQNWEDVPETILSREGAISAEQALREVSLYIHGIEAQELDYEDSDNGRLRIHWEGDTALGPDPGA